MPDRNDDALEELHTLVGDLRARDPAALARCYELTADMLASIAVGILRDRHAAEDVVQDVFVRFVGAVGDLRGDDGYAVRGWLVRATRNRCIDRLRSAAHQREDQVEELPETADAGSADPLADELDPDMLTALGALTEDQRTALVLRYVSDLSGNEIGEILDRNRAAVYQLLRRAERSLRTELTRVRSAPARPSPGSKPPSASGGPR